VTTSDLDTKSLLAELQQLRADFGRVADSLRVILQQRGSETLGKAHDAADKVWDEARKQADTVVREIESRPVAAAVSAFGLGMMLGMLFGSRR